MHTLTKKLRSLWWDVLLGVSPGVRGVSVRLKIGAPTLHRTLKNVYHKIMRPPHSVVAKFERNDLPYGEIVTVDGIRMRVHKSLSPKQVWRLISRVHSSEVFGGAVSYLFGPSTLVVGKR